MANMNKVFLIGNLTRDVELKYIPSGAAVAQSAIAINRKDRGGQEHTTFVNLEVWEKQAEQLAEYCRKGSPILVEGELKQDRWEDKEGNKREKILVRAFRIQFLGKMQGQEQGQAQPEQQSSFVDTAGTAGVAEQEPPMPFVASPPAPADSGLPF